VCKKHIFIFRRTDRGMSETPKKKEGTSVEITEGRGGVRDYQWCLKRRNKREEGLLCPSFFLPAGLRDDGVCPRGRRFSSRLVDRVRVSQLERREKERESESGVYRGAPGGTRGPLATGILNVGGTTGAPPGYFSPAYLTYVPATFPSFPSAPPPFSCFSSFCSSRPLHYHSASWSSRSFHLFFLDHHHSFFLFA